MKQIICRGRYLSTLLGLCGLVLMASGAQAQKRTANAYIGYVYPAGGQQGTTFQVRIGGQRTDGAYGATVSGEGVDAKQVDYLGSIPNQMVSIMKQQAKMLKKPKDADEQRIFDRIQMRTREYERRPANRSIAVKSIIEVTIDVNAEPGEREIRIMTPKGLSNPLPFHVSQIQEVSRKPMLTAKEQILGNEQTALRKRPDDEIEETITVPCVMNGQIASGEVNRYRFKAGKGQKLVITTLARQLIPYIADAVPGWFQPVLTLHNADGKEVAFNDDFHFKPDPTILYRVPKDGEYVLTINDAIYRGREDFVYRITIGELPFITSVFPLGNQMGKKVNVKTVSWNLGKVRIQVPAGDAGEGIHLIAANGKDLISNHVPYMLSDLPQRSEKENNNDIAHAQNVKMPIIINGISNIAGDWDVFKVQANAGDTIVAEVHARRLDSPLDSIVKLTDAAGNLLAFNDDHADPGNGLNTHHADSYLMVEVQESGDYYIHLTDATQLGGRAYAYRLRISKPRPDFELRTMPSSLHFNKPAPPRGKSKSKNKSAQIPMSRSSITVYAIRKDGYTGPITLRLKNAPEGFRANEVIIKPEEEKIVFSVQAVFQKIKQPVALTIEGYAEIQNQEVSRAAVPTEDWMQAFLWRHLVPAQELLAHAYEPRFNPLPPKREHPKLPFEKEDTAAQTPELIKQQKQVAAYIRQLDSLYQDWLITDDYYLKKAAEFRDLTQQKQAP